MKKVNALFLILKSDDDNSFKYCDEEEKDI